VVFVADSHISLLETIARHRQRRVAELESGPDRSSGRRVQLARAAERARAQVTAAAARRRLPPDR
jgi:hypothetical protein